MKNYKTNLGSGRCKNTSTWKGATQNMCLPWLCPNMLKGNLRGATFIRLGDRSTRTQKARDPSLAHFFILMLNNSLRNVSGKDFEPSRCSNAEAAAT